MGVTLDELLSRSGITVSADDTVMDKTASAADAQTDEVTLVDELRKVAGELANPAKGTIKEQAARELTEKTAEIMVIAKTLDEINRLTSLGQQPQLQKEAARKESSSTKLATFIKVALDQGHTEEQIASFLEKQGSSRVGRAMASALQTLRRPFARAGQRAGEHAIDAEIRLLRDKLVHGNRAEILKHLTHVEGKLGRPNLEKMLKEVAGQGTRLHPEAMRYLPKGALSGGNMVSMKMPSGKELHVSAKKLKSIGTGAGAGAVGLGTGMALKKKKDSGSGVVVVNK